MTSLEKLVVAYDLSNLISRDDFLKLEESQHYVDYDHFCTCQADGVWEDFCEEVGQRLINMGGKVHVKGYNLGWQGRDGQKTIELNTSHSASEVGRSFMFKVAKSIEYAYLYYVGKYDTKKSFNLIIPTHDCVMTFEVKRKR